MALSSYENQKCLKVLPAELFPLENLFPIPIKNSRKFFECLTVVECCEEEAFVRKRTKAREV